MSAIHFGNAFALRIDGMTVAETNLPLTSAIGTAQLKTAAGAAIGDAVSLVHNGSGNYRASFPETLFDENPAALAVGSHITIEVLGSAPAFRFDIVAKVKARG